MKTKEKKNYVAPEMHVYEMMSPQLLAGSGNTEELNERTYDWQNL